jgi:hypothetical protein
MGSGAAEAESFGYLGLLLCGDKSWKAVGEWNEYPELGRRLLRHPRVRPRSCKIDQLGPRSL